jgi:general secretion pathway protein F
MTAFHFTAITAGGELKRGVLEAESAAAVIDSLQRDGLIPMRAEPVGRRHAFSDLLHLELTPRRGLSRDQIAAVTRELATMLAAGQDIDRALRFVSETAPNKRVAGVMSAVREKVRGGSPLATALAAPPAEFPKLYVGLVRAGESGGTLARTLEHLAQLLERQRALSATVASALVYPALLLAAAIGTVFLLIGYVLPQFVPLFQENDIPLPFATRMLIGLGAVASGEGPWLLAGGLVLAVIAWRLLAEPAWRRRADTLLLGLPILGGLMRETAAARFCRTLGTLLGNGMPLIGALGITRDTLGNLAVIAAVDAATASARGGGGLARPLAAAAVFPARTIHLLRLGEETAQLAPVALKAAEIHEENTRLIVQRLVSLLVPVITIAMGAAVAGIVGSLLLAMLSLNDLAN